MNLNNLAMIEEQNLRLREENELLRRALSETDCGYRLIQQRDEFAKLIDFGKTIGNRENGGVDNIGNLMDYGC